MAGGGEASLTITKPPLSYSQGEFLTTCCMQLYMKFPLISKKAIDWFVLDEI
jgi:hypothetical protein